MIANLKVKKNKYVVCYDDNKKVKLNKTEENKNHIIGEIFKLKKSCLYPDYSKQNFYIESAGLFAIGSAALGGAALLSKCFTSDDTIFYMTGLASGAFAIGAVINAIIAGVEMKKSSEKEKLSLFGDILKYQEYEQSQGNYIDDALDLDDYNKTSKIELESRKIGHMFKKTYFN